jgi:hypothetical protein
MKILVGYDMTYRVSLTDISGLPRKCLIIQILGANGKRITLSYMIDKIHFNEIL